MTVLAGFALLRLHLADGFARGVEYGLDAGVIGFGEAVDYVKNIGFEAIQSHESELLAYATARLNASIFILDGEKGGAGIYAGMPVDDGA